MHLEEKEDLMNRLYILVITLVLVFTGNVLNAQHGRSMNHIPRNIIHQQPRVNIPVHVNPSANNIRSHANSNSIYGTGNYNNKKNNSSNQNNTIVKGKDKEDKQDKEDRKQKNKKKK
jgi:hypothetical protein